MNFKLFCFILIFFGCCLFVSMGSQAALIADKKNDIDATLYKVNVAGVVFCGVIALILIILGVLLLMGKLTLCDVSVPDISLSYTSA